MKSSASEVDSGVEHIRMYYEHQYDRMAKLEDQRLIITNIVIGLTTLAFTFGFSEAEDLTALTGICLPGIMVVSNVLAIAYVWHSADVIVAHQKRAKRVLQLYAQRLYNIDRAIPWSRRIGPRWKIQLVIHLLLMMVSLVPLCIYFTT